MAQRPQPQAGGALLRSPLPVAVGDAAPLRPDGDAGRHQQAANRRTAHLIAAGQSLDALLGQVAVHHHRHREPGLLGDDAIPTSLEVVGEAPEPKHLPTAPAGIGDARVDAAEAPP